MAATLRSLVVSQFVKKIPALNTFTLATCFRPKPSDLPHASLRNLLHTCYINNVGSLQPQMTARYFSSVVLGWKNVDESKCTRHAVNVWKGELLQSFGVTPVFQPHRNHIKFSFGKGKQKTVKPAVRRFFRLHWGAWIRPKCGRAKKLWKKNWKRKQRLRRHVFCNSTQNQLLTHMVTKFWKTPKYYVDDPYEPYHIRHGVYRRSPHNPL